MSYTKQDWHDSPATDTPLSAARLAHMEDGIEAAAAGPGFATKTGAYTATAADDYIAADATTAAFTVTLPSAAGLAGKTITVKKVDSSTNAVTVAASSSQTIDGLPSHLLVFRYQVVTVLSDGANWLVVESNYCGTELGYAESTTTASTTNTAFFSAADNKIAGLSITTVGTGRPVLVTFKGLINNSTGNTWTGVSLLTNGAVVAGPTAGGFNPINSQSYNNGVILQSRKVLTAGTKYTFEVGMFCQSGTGQIIASAYTPMLLAVVGQ